MTHRPDQIHASKRPLALLLAMCVWGFSVAARAEAPSLDDARAFFERYQQLERSFDPELASLYADDAVVWVTRIYANGVIRQLKIPGDIYSMAIRQSMAEAAEHGDFNEYSDVQYEPDGQQVRIEASRFNLWRNYRSPYSALLRRDDEGRWRIVEEHFETRVPTAASE